MAKIRIPSGRTVRKGGVSVSLEWSPEMGAVWSARYRLVQQMLDMEIIKRTDPYVPLESGVLKNSAPLASDIGGGQIVYATPYAAAQYYGTADTRPYDPLRGAHWFERMKADNSAYLEAFVRKAMRSI